MFIGTTGTRSSPLHRPSSQMVAGPALGQSILPPLHHALHTNGNSNFQIDCHRCGNGARIRKTTLLRLHSPRVLKNTIAKWKVLSRTRACPSYINQSQEHTSGNSQKVNYNIQRSAKALSFQDPVALLTGRSPKHVSPAGLRSFRSRLNLITNRIRPPTEHSTREYAQSLLKARRTITSLTRLNKSIGCVTTSVI
jgi:hypothetical protein